MSKTELHQLQLKLKEILSDLELLKCPEIIEVNNSIETAIGEIEWAIQTLLS